MSIKSFLLLITFFAPTTVFALQKFIKKEIGYKVRGTPVFTLDRGNNKQPFCLHCYLHAKEGEGISGASFFIPEKFNVIFYTYNSPKELIETQGDVSFFIDKQRDNLYSCAIKKDDKIVVQKFTDIRKKDLFFLKNFISKFEKGWFRKLEKNNGKKQQGIIRHKTATLYYLLRQN